MSLFYLSIVSAIIIIIVCVSTILMTNSAYKYEHKVDPTPKQKQDPPTKSS